MVTQKISSDLSTYISYLSIYPVYRQDRETINKIITEAFTCGKINDNFITIHNNHCLVQFSVIKYFPSPLLISSVGVWYYFCTSCYRFRNTSASMKILFRSFVQAWVVEYYFVLKLVSRK